MVANCVCGLTIVQCQHLFVALVIPVLTYSCVVWHTGIWQKGLVQILQVAQNVGVRWLTGTFRTVPVEEAGHLASIPPIKFVLEKLTCNATIQLLTIPHGAETLQCIEPTAQRVGKPSTLKLLGDHQPPSAETTTPFHSTPWERHGSAHPRLQILLPLPGMPKAACKAQEREILARVNHHLEDMGLLVAFTNGLCMVINWVKCTGCAASLTWGG
jgi:hypothetical protein